MSGWPWLALGLTSLTVLGLALWLHPSPAGHGTHTQLGLPPCGFLAFTGLPCPGCGLTTSFAHLVRLQFDAGLHANPMGLPLFAVTVLTAPFSALAWWRGWGLAQVVQRLQLDRALFWLAGGALAAWAGRLAGLL